MSVQTPSKPLPVKRAEAAGEKVGQSRGFELLARAGFVASVLFGARLGIRRAVRRRIKAGR